MRRPRKERSGDRVFVAGGNVGSQSHSHTSVTNGYGYVLATGAFGTRLPPLRRWGCDCGSLQTSYSRHHIHNVRVDSYCRAFISKCTGIIFSSVPSSVLRAPKKPPQKSPPQLSWFVFSTSTGRLVVVVSKGCKSTRYVAAFFVERRWSFVSTNRRRQRGSLSFCNYSSSDSRRALHAAIAGSVPLRPTFVQTYSRLYRRTQRCD